MKPPFEVMFVQPHQLAPHPWAVVEIGARYVLLICRGNVTRDDLADVWTAFVNLHRSRGVEYLYAAGEPVCHLVPFVSETGDGIAMCGGEPWLGLGSPTEWARAHELPLCEECKKWATGRTHDGPGRSHSRVLVVA